MDQFRQVGEILGSLKALLVLKHDISINQKQCCLLFDMLEFAVETISEEIRQNLRLEERNTKWKSLELPMKELHRIFKEAELYIRYCLDVRDWWGKSISLHMNRDCVEFHIHNLLCCFTVVIEAIETAAEISGMDQEEMQKRRVTLMKKYDEAFADLKLFQWKYGKQYLVPREICIRLDTAWKEDRWWLIQKIEEKKRTASKHEQRLAELLLKKLNDTNDDKLMPSHVLVGSQDYYVKRRLGGAGGGHFKEINWLGESFALRTFFGDIEPPLNKEISSILSLSHPNVLQYHCAFYEEDRKEGFLVMELMSKDLGTYIKENSGQRKRIPFSIPVAVDIMLQIARGMEYLHARKIYHGDLNPSMILVKARNSSTDGLFLAKIAGFGLTSVKSTRSPKPNGTEVDIWLAPEVLGELEKPGGKATIKYTEKADVYSFAMLCFELLTGKIPFQDSHLQGEKEKMIRNVKAGERPLFPHPSTKYLVNLTRRCWQTNPNQRPTFSSICRILRFIKKNLVINPDHGHPDSPPPLVDYGDIETGYLKKFEPSGDLVPVSQIPFQMFGYRLVENEKVSGKQWDSGIDGSVIHHPASLGGDYDENLGSVDDLFPPSDRRSVCSEIIDRKVAMFDQRSVISEIPTRKLFPSEHRSIGSLSPGRFSAVPTDQRSVGAETPQHKYLVKRADQSSHQASERNINQKSSNLKLVVDLPENGTVPKVSEGQPSSPSPLPTPSSSSTENSIPSTKGNEQKSVSPEIIEKKLLPKSVINNKTAFSELSEAKISTPRAKAHQKLAEIPEKKILKSEASNEKVAAVSSRISAKKSELTDTSIQKSSKNSDATPLAIKKLRDSRTKSLPGKPISDSPRSSPARTRKTKPLFSPSSSPARTSPARVKKTRPVFSPSSSPARVTNTCASPKRSVLHAQVDCSSPGASPLHPCTRCSRLGRQTSLPSNSPARPSAASASHSIVM